MKALLVRHGETAYNAQGIFQSYAPIPLAARGRQQAALVAQRLRTLWPTVLYSSDIARAHETATIIGQYLGLSVQPAEGLREWNTGNWVGRLATEYTAHLEALGAHPVTYVPDGGESQLQTQARIIAQMQAFASQHSDETILCVSHGMAIDLFTRYILGLDVMSAPAYRIINTSVSIFQCQNGIWEVLTLNDVSHLEGERQTTTPTA